MSEDMNYKLPPLPHWCEPGSQFAEQMQAYATAATEPLLQRIAELERQLEEARKQALEEAVLPTDPGARKAWSHYVAKEGAARQYFSRMMGAEGSKAVIVKRSELQKRPSMNIQELAKQAGWTQTSIDMASAEEMARLERFRALVLEEAANAVDAMKAPDGYGIQEQSLYDVATMEAADVVRALKGAKE